MRNQERNGDGPKEIIAGKTTQAWFMETFVGFAEDEFIF
jgi:hypothetical protein